MRCDKHKLLSCVVCTRKLKLSVTEDTIEEHLDKSVKSVNGWCVKLPGVLMPGWPDRMVLLPGGRIVFVELKRPKGGKFERLQPLIHAKLRRLGFLVMVWNTKQQINVFFQELK